MVAKMQAALALIGPLMALAPRSVSGYDNTRNDNVAVYWGQNSYGATHTSDTANWQKNLSSYCTDDSIDAFPLAFLDIAFGTGGYPSLDLANICNVNDDTVFSGTELPDCSFMASDIQTCQAAGKIVTLSIGGATGSVSFTDDAQAVTFANTIWDLFLGGSNDTRPFGDAVLDGIDLDLEGGSPNHWPAFVTQIRTLAEGADKSYYFTAAPQCPFPDAYVGDVLNSVGFDAVYVQFYNNYCGLTNFDNANDWNFATWDNWAKTVSPNPNVKVYIGAPASSTAAGSGYVDAATLASDALATREQYSSFGGVMLWDASQAAANGNFAASIKSALSSGGTSVPTTSVASTTKAGASTTSVGTTTSAATSTSATTSASTTTSASSGSCGVVAAWLANIAYETGNQVTYNGDLWTANWWSYGDTPGGASGDWTDNGPCASVQVDKTNYRTAEAHASIPATAEVNPTASASFLSSLSAASASASSATASASSATASASKRTVRISKE